MARAELVPRAPLVLGAQLLQLFGWLLGRLAHRAPPVLQCGPPQSPLEAGVEHVGPAEEYEHELRHRRPLPEVHGPRGCAREVREPRHLQLHRVHGPPLHKWVIVKRELLLRRRLRTRPPLLVVPPHREGTGHLHEWFPHPDLQQFV